MKREDQKHRMTNRERLREAYRESSFQECLEICKSLARHRNRFEFVLEFANKLLWYFGNRRWQCSGCGFRGITGDSYPYGQHTHCDGCGAPVLLRNPECIPVAAIAANIIRELLQSPRFRDPDWHERETSHGYGGLHQQSMKLYLRYLQCLDIWWPRKFMEWLSNRMKEEGEKVTTESDKNLVKIIRTPDLKVSFFNEIQVHWWHCTLNSALYPPVPPSPPSRVETKSIGIPKLLSPSSHGIEPPFRAEYRRG